MILYRPGVRPGMCCVMNPCAELCISVRGTAHLQKGLYIFLQIWVLERCASIQCTVIHILQSISGPLDTRFSETRGARARGTLLGSVGKGGGAV
jgi:hypothetical protein